MISAAKSSAKPAPEITFLECDLASLPSVQSAARTFASQSTRLDILMNNAGIMAVAPGLTPQGYEIQFGTNHVGHALLTKLLLPTLQRTADSPGADVRIVDVTSLGFTVAPKGGILFPELKTRCDWGMGTEWKRYGQSKLANVLHAAELARRYPNILSVSVHPGVVSTDLNKRLGLLNKIIVRATNPRGMLSPPEGAYNQCWAATAPREKVKSGSFYEPVGVQDKTKTEYSTNGKMAEELWEWTDKELAGYEL